MKVTMFDDIDRYWMRLEELAHHIPLRLVGRAADILLECQQRGGTVFALGNGGSAATASHFVCDLTKGTRHYGPPTFRAVALSDNIALMTAWANDSGFERIFAEQLTSLVHPGDVVLAISTSGNSPNVVLAAQEARTAGAQVIALTGPTAGQLHRHADLAICVPSDCVELVEDAHLAIAHSLCVALRKTLHSDVPLDEAAGSTAVASTYPRLVR